ncbi:MAG: L-histidine N(alpha)-methyltransferase [Gammaproteobacteria bacterium]|nr:L-histidine N(alpha)-methyltransferase [Gammaproteobacteria bacterium]
MNCEEQILIDTSRIQVCAVNNKPVYADLAQDVRDGLMRFPKELPPKYFYDEQGSRLFDQICNTPEYYQTRTESLLLRTHAVDIIDQTLPELIVELGSGASRKTKHLLDACHRTNIYPVYQPVDICGEMIVDAGNRLLDHYDWLEIKGIVGDYCTNLPVMADHAASRLFVFLGGTLGNFDDCEARDFLQTLRSTMNSNDWLLIGIDRVKDVDVLNAAYNDANGYTAAFNRNVLSVINRELSACFNPDAFQHEAWFNESKSRIEMHLRSRKEQEVLISDLDLNIEFSENESILTEISRKFTLENFSALLSQNGFELHNHYEPGNGYFSLILARPSTNLPSPAFID